MKYTINKGFLHLFMVPAFALSLSLPLWAEEIKTQAQSLGEVAPAATDVILAKERASIDEPSEKSGEVKHINFRTALARASKYSPDLKAAISRYKQAKWNTKNVETGHNPRLTMNSNYVLNAKESVVKLPDFSMTMTPTHAFSVSLVLEQSLYTFGRLHCAEVVARLNEELVREEFRQYYENELYTTANYYANCLLAREQLDIAKRQLALREKSLQEAEALFNAGTNAKFDVLRVNTAVSGARQVVITSENNYNLALSQLCSRLGYPMSTKLELDTLEIDNITLTNIVDKIDIESSYDSAMQCRPEIHILDWSKRVAEANYEYTGTMDNPNLALQSTLSGNMGSGNNGFSTGWSWATGIALSVPIVDGGQRKTLQGQIRESINELDENIASAKRSIKLDVKNCYLNLLSTWSQIAAAEDSLIHAKETDRVAMVRYEAGLSTSTELLDAHTALGEAETALANSKYGYFLAIVDWVRAISGRYPVSADNLVDDAIQEMLSPEEYEAKVIDWYSLRNKEHSKMDELYEDRLQDPTIEDEMSEIEKEWQRKRNEIHEREYKRCLDEEYVPSKSVKSEK